MNLRRLWYDPELPQTFYVLLWGRLFNMIGNSLVFTFLSLYLASRLNGSMSLVGITLALYGVVQVAAVLAGGILADAWGRRRVMLLSLGGGAVACFLVGSMHPLWAVFPALGLMGTLMPLFQPASMALTADIVPQHKLNQAYGLLRMASNAGIMIGPMLGSFLADIGYFWLFAVDAVTLLIFLAIVWRRIPETGPTHHESARSTFEGLLAVSRDRPFLGFAALWSLTYVVYSQLYQVVPAYLHLRLHFPPGVFGYLAAENALLVVLLQQPIIRWVSRIPGRWPLSVGLFCYAVGFALMLHGRWLLTFGIAVAVITIGENLVNPTASTWVAERADPRLRGRYLGFFSLAQRVGQSVGPLAGGFLVTVGATPWLLSIAGVALLTGAGYRRVRAARATPISPPTPSRAAAP